MKEVTAGKCAVPNCASDHRDITCHRFPKDPLKAKIWKDAVQNPSISSMDNIKLNKSYCICKLHFSPHDYLLHTKRPTLKSSAVPRFLLPRNNQNLLQNISGVSRTKKNINSMHNIKTVAFATLLHDYFLIKLNSQAYYSSKILFCYRDNKKIVLAKYSNSNYHENKCTNMVSICSARGCNSNQNTKINGRNIHFFPFPMEISLKEQWEHKSNLPEDKDCGKRHCQLCELHFEKSNFTEDYKLKPNAVPTIFEFPKKRQCDDAPIQDILKVKELKVKQIKLEEGTHSLVTPPHSPEAQLIPAVKVESTSEEKAPHDDEQCAFKKIGVTTSLFTKQIDIGKKVYRLTIRIDKTRARPCPKSKKKHMTLQPKNNTQEKVQKANESHSNDRLTVQRNINRSRQNSLCDITGCKLQKTLLNKKPVFKCECCARYYIVKRSTGQNEKNKSCFVCHFVFPTRQALCLHIRKHFACDMCGTECGTQISFNKHARQHVSTDPTLPYKCHKCLEIFETKSDVRQHNLLIHSEIKLENKTDMGKKPINRIHVQERYRRLEFTCDLCQKTFQSSKLLDAHRAGHTGTLKFTCRVCCKEFDSVEDVDMHTKIHLEVVKEEHKCNICKKLFKMDSLLNEHLRGHLSRAHHCPICPKAFINRTTLRIHLKTHSAGTGCRNDLKNTKTKRGKTYCCTLCREEFNTYSDMYSHIMTHLEKMHEDGSRSNIDDIAEILDIEDS